MIQLEETSVGYKFEGMGFSGLFGNAKANLSNVEAAFPNLKFARLKQTHSDIFKLVRKPTSEITNLEQLEVGDALISSEVNLAVGIFTADCIPVLVHCSLTKRVAAIHAGWRGVANRITVKVIHHLLNTGSSANTLSMIIGPHIQKPSFEIQLEVLETLLACTPKAGELRNDLSTQNGDRFLLDLNLLLKLQISEFDIPADQIHCLMIDTKSDLRFHSYRRDHEKSGRQFSFICLK